MGGVNVDLGQNSIHGIARKKSYNMIDVYHYKTYYCRNFDGKAVCFVTKQALVYRQESNKM